MINLSSHISLNGDAESPLYLQITNQVIGVIQRGVARPGTKLPGSRMLSQQLKVHRKTVVWAYDELLAQGWIEVFARKGVFVTQRLPLVRPVRLSHADEAVSYPIKTQFAFDEVVRTVSPPVNNNKVRLALDAGFPDVRLTPIDLLMREFRSIARRGAFRKHLTYGSPEGSQNLREALATHINESRGMRISAENILITSGAQMAIYLSAALLVKPGDTVVVGAPGYFAANLAFEQAGAKLCHIPVDDLGLDVNAVEKLCKKRKIKMLYVIPHHHLPTSVTLSAERRMQLLELASKYRFAIIEDDYDYDLHYDFNPVLPMASQDYHGNVLYIGTLTKIFAPSIRIGFLVAPKNFIVSAANLRRVIDRQGDTILEEAVAALYSNGTINRHIKKVRNIYRERRDLFCEYLKTKLGDKISFQIPQGGMSVWTRFNGADIESVSVAAIKKGLYLGNGSYYNYYGKTKNQNAERLGFASLNNQEIDEATTLLREAVVKVNR